MKAFHILLGSIVFLAYIFMLFFMDPLLIIWGLNLLGFDVDLTWQTYTGAFLLIFVIKWSKKFNFGESWKQQEQTES